MNLLVLLGQTSSGKSQMAVDLALKLNKTNQIVWIVNCDSRQVYKGLNLGTGKVEGGWQNDIYFYKEVPHYLIDYVDPQATYSLNQYLQDFKNLFLKDKPGWVILTGGTGLFAKAIIEQFEDYQVELSQNDKIKYEQQKTILNHLSLSDLQYQYLRIIADYQVSQESKNMLKILALKTLELSKNSRSQTQKILEKMHGLESDRFEKIKILNNSDFFNSRRLVNFLLRNYAKDLTTSSKNIVRQPFPEFEKTLSCAIQIEKVQLKENIVKRINQRIEEGLLEEIQNFYKLLGSKKLLELGLEYRLGYYFLIGALSSDEFKKKLLQENLKLAKRQLTWLNKQNLNWVQSLEELEHQTQNG